MKKIFFILGLLIFISSCNNESSFLPEGEYKYISDTPNDVEINISFDNKEKRFYGNSGVNRYFGTYEQEGNKLTFSPIGSTMMAGPLEVMKEEREYLNKLNNVEGFQVEGEELILETGNEEKLIFRRVK